MSNHRPGLRDIVGINLKIVGGLGLAVLARWMWAHASVLWWGRWPLSILFGLGALTAFADAIGAVKALVHHDLEQRSFRRKGVAPRSDRLVSPDTLRKKGLIK
ncbi:hypothetical protein FJU08_00705 [Martelella alba]|uniref:Uncharacterized protein n=1 Tax=Martelella alba TaxID=2590451 RepID=A0A506UIJ8_9HYPH|nr:hypothetical protein [Martelella alba]TPW33122.1 hypothetical protein FJU08_00705 [Martelella alba]